MFVRSFILALGMSSLIAATPIASLPTIDLGDAVHRATSYDVLSSPPISWVIISILIKSPTGVFRRLCFLQYPFRRAPDWRPPFWPPSTTFGEQDNQ